MIIEQASFDSRRNVLRNVCHYFREQCQHHRRSDRAKQSYVRFMQKSWKIPCPFVLDIPFDGIEWRCWSAGRCGFNSESAFRAFCALGNVDPESGLAWKPKKKGFADWIWISKTRDIVFQTYNNPLHLSGKCVNFGLTGIADKAILMFNFMHDRFPRNSNLKHKYEDGMETYWRRIMWNRRRF